MVEQLALACRMLVLARRSQQIGQWMRQQIESAPLDVFSATERRDMTDRDARDLQQLTAALDRVNSLTGSPAIGAVVLERTNELIRAEYAKQCVGTARMALTRAPFDALAELINESEAFLQVEPGCPVTADQLARARVLLSALQRAGAHHFANLGSLSWT